jgi:hypothetical protein
VENTPNPEKTPLEIISDAIRNAKLVEITTATTPGDGSLVIELLINGQLEVTLSAADVRLVRGTLAQLAAEPPNLRGRYNRVKRATEMSLDELRSRNLPLYWNKAWLLAQLAEHKTYSAVARAHGYTSATAIASFAKRNHGIDIQEQYDQKRNALLEQYHSTRSDADAPTQIALAREFSVALATVYRWIKEDEAGLTPKPGRTRKR